MATKTGKARYVTEEARKLQELRATVATVPYPSQSAGGPNKYVIARWRRDAVAAGYPICEECGSPIVKSYWEFSITQCQRCWEEQQEDERGDEYR